MPGFEYYAHGIASLDAEGIATMFCGWRSPLAESVLAPGQSPTRPKCPACLGAFAFASDADPPDDRRRSPGPATV